MILQKKMIQKIVRPLIGLILFILMWHVVSSYLLADTSTLPNPYKVSSSLKEMWHSGELIEDIISSLDRILIGFAIAFSTSILFGIIAARYAKTYLYIKVTMDLLSSIPPIAWTPVAILWFGIGDVPAYFIVFLGAFFPMFTSIYSGITNVDSELIDAAKTLGASNIHVIRSVILPSSLPQILTGIKTGIGVAWFNVIAAELIGVRSGLGYKIQLNRTLLFSENVIGIMLVIGLIGFLMTRFVGFVGNILTPWSIQDPSRPSWIKLQKSIKLIYRKILLTLYRENNNINISKHEIIQKDNLTKIDTPKILLEVNYVSKSFPGQSLEDKLEVTKDISFNINSQEVFAILGPNGCGKTTIVKIIAGLITPDNGTVIFDSEKVTSTSNERTVVFQNYALFPWKTSKGNIRFSLESSFKNCKDENYTSENIDILVNKYLGEANLNEFAETYPFDLSGGMKQRLALARALAASPKLILMDEPFASFDPIIREKSQETILQLLQNRNITILLVTHDLDEAIFMSDRILVLSKRPSKIKEIIKIDLPNPRTSEMRKSKYFHDVRTHIWELLRD